MAQYLKHVVLCLVLTLAAASGSEPKESILSSSEPKKSVVSSSKPVPKESVMSSSEPKKSVVPGSKPVPKESVMSSSEPKKSVVFSSKPVPKESVMSSSEPKKSVVSSSKPVPKESVMSRSEPIPKESVVSSSEPIPKESVVSSREPNEIVVSNNVKASVGGARFDKEIGAQYTKQTLINAMDFIHRLFQQNNDAADTQSVQKVSVMVENIDGVAFASSNNIHISAGYIEKYPQDIKKEITGVLYHEMAHVMQWNGNGQAPSGLIEGIADFVRMKAGYAADHWNPPGVGYDWNQGYEVTAHFLNYCNSIKNGFVADLNKKMENSYSESYFSEILGKPVTQLWSDYKAMYANN